MSELKGVFKITPAMRSIAVSEAIKNEADKATALIILNMTEAIWLDILDVTRHEICECGAEHTSNPRHHSAWCPKYGASI